jgi:hypothetical protein
MAVAQGFRTYRVGDLGGQIRNRAGRSKIDLRGGCFYSPASILTVFQAASKQKRRVGVRRKEHLGRCDQIGLMRLTGLIG